MLRLFVCLFDCLDAMRCEGRDRMGSMVFTYFLFWRSGELERDGMGWGAVVRLGYGC